MKPPYDQNIVLDLEFTPVRAASSPQGDIFPRREIIQVGAVRVSATGEPLDTFGRFVKPSFAKEITPFVRRLTGIRGCDVIEAAPLETVLRDFESWVGAARTRFVAWSSSDYNQLLKETRAKGVAFPCLQGRWLDLQRVYPRVMVNAQRRKKMNLHTAADWCGIVVSDEQLHGALYDATLTAELLSSLLTKESVEQKKKLFSAMVAPDSRKTLSASIGSRFGALASLRDELMLAQA